MQRILIIDDSSFMRNTIAIALRSSRVQCHQAEDGQAALDSLRQSYPDLIISDYEMPRMDGLEFLQRLRSYAEFRETPVIMLSSAGRPDVLAKASELKAKFVSKPFDFDSFQELVAAELRGVQGAC